MSRPATEKSALKKKEELSKPVTAPRTPQWWGQPYWQLARMHKFPVGSNLVIMLVWGWLLALPARPDAWTLTVYIVAFMLAGTVLHSAACTINDICDVDFDRQVERCKNRPLVSGAVSIPAAWVFLLAQTGVFLWMLSSPAWNSWWCGVFGVFPLHAFYPLMKRWTNWPQAGAHDYRPRHELGSAHRLADGRAAGRQVGRDVGADVRHVLLDDPVRHHLRAAGQEGRCASRRQVHRAPLRVLRPPHPRAQNELYFTITVGGTAAHIAWQLITLNVDDPSDCFDKFVANGNLGYIVTAGMLASIW